MDKKRHNFYRRIPTSVPRISVDTAEDSMRDLRLGTLLPGISDHITVAEIAPKLSWNNFHMLSCVSRGWRHAIRSRLIYEARVRSQTTETLVLLYDFTEETPLDIALFSMRDGSFHHLPPFPRGIAPGTNCISVEGKVYVLGEESRDVHVLDLAGQMHWKQCAQTRERSSFENIFFPCAVMNGKIYIVSKDDGQVYDPKRNTWSPIRPMPMTRFYMLPEVATLGEELAYYDSQISDGLGDLLLYHPIRDEWREIQYNGPPEEEDFALLIVKGKLYSITFIDIHVYDDDKKSWSKLHTLARIRVESVKQRILIVVAVEDELLACVGTGHSGYMDLVQSKGFGGNKKEILWEDAPVDLQCADIFVSTIEL